MLQFNSTREAIRRLGGYSSSCWFLGCLPCHQLNLFSQDQYTIAKYATIRPQREHVSVSYERKALPSEAMPGFVALAEKVFANSVSPVIVSDQVRQMRPYS